MVDDFYGNLAKTDRKPYSSAHNIFGTLVGFHVSGRAQALR